MKTYKLKGLILTAMVGLGLLLVVQQIVRRAAGKKLPSIEIAEAQIGSYRTDIMAQGSVVPSDVANVTVLPQFEAQVTHVYVNNGSYVKKGQVLADLDPIDQQDQLDQAGEGAVVARSQYELTLNPHRKEEIHQAYEAVLSANAKYNLIRHPHRPEEIRQMQLRLDSDRQTVTAATAKLTILRDGNKPQVIRESEDAVESARAKLELARSEHLRSTVLYGKDLVPKAELEQSATAETVARNALAQAQEQLSVLKEGYGPEEIQIAIADLKRAQLSLQEDEQAYSVLKQGSRPEEIQQAESGLHEARLAYSILCQGSRAEQVQEARSLYKKASLAFNHQQRLFQHRLIRAPISGIVIAKNVNAGEIASPGSPRSDGNASLENNPRSLFIIADNDPVEFMASVDQRFYHTLAVGCPASVSLEAFPGRSFSGKIIRINPLINPDVIGRGSNTADSPTAPLTFSVWVRLPNKNKTLVLGHIGLMQAHHEESGLTIPQSALTSFTLGEGTVYVEKDGVLQVRSVRYDGNTDGLLHVISGVRAGEHVVVSAQQKLSDGMSVMVMPSGLHNQ